MNESNVLTSQEQRVAELAGKGLSNRQIGAELNITEKTVKFHLTNVYRKLGVTRYQLIGNPNVTAAAVLASETQVENSQSNSL
jgi:DNA-binding NarL/FixJ family response regulator